MKRKLVYNGFLLLAETAVMFVTLPALPRKSPARPVRPAPPPRSTGNNSRPPPGKFGGVIKESALDSTPYWPPRVVPPKGAPNVLLIMTDDQGYGVSGTFGGVIPTPALDRVAKAGLRYTQFHSTASVLADAGGADHRAQPPLGWFRRHR